MPVRRDSSERDAKAGGGMDGREKLHWTGGTGKAKTAKIVARDSVDLAKASAHEHAASIVDGHGINGQPGGNRGSGKAFVKGAIGVEPHQVGWSGEAPKSGGNNDFVIRLD